MCNCISEREKLIADTIRKSNPTAVVFNAELQNKGLFFTKNDQVRVTLEFVIDMDVTDKSGKVKSKKVKQSLVLARCPFCGVEYKND